MAWNQTGLILTMGSSGLDLSLSGGSNIMLDETGDSPMKLIRVPFQT